jgi:hypothetical protein
LDGANHDLRAFSLVFRLDSDPELWVLEGNSGGGLLQELTTMGEDESFVSFPFAQLTDEGTKEGGFAGSCGHNHEDAVETLVLAGENLSESLGLIGAQKDLGDFHRDSYRRSKRAVWCAVCCTVEGNVGHIDVRTCSSRP